MESNRRRYESNDERFPLSETFDVGNGAAGHREEYRSKQPCDEQQRKEAGSSSSSYKSIRFGKDRVMVTITKRFLSLGYLILLLAVGVVLAAALLLDGE